jgi:predicted amidophosphoribosyltransferase
VTVTAVESAVALQRETNWSSPLLLRPSSSRCRLEWKVFEQIDPTTFKLVLPRFYAGLFEVSLPSLAKKTISGFKDSSTGKTRMATLADLDDAGLKKVQHFIQWYERAVCLGINQRLGDTFSDELDFCFALDTNRTAPGSERTQIGEWEYQAKYAGDKAALDALAKELCVAVRMLPRSRFPRPRLLSSVPASHGGGFHLVGELATKVAAGVPSVFWGVAEPLTPLSLTSDKKSAKNQSVEEKVAEWHKLIISKGIRCSKAVRGCSVILLDDLYQSGATLWSIAKYLKDQGASAVVGVACVKSLRDTDNR